MSGVKGTAVRENLSDKEYANELKKRGSTGGGFAKGLCVNCDRPLKGGRCPVCDKS